jgi:hypothetical protein
MDKNNALSPKLDVKLLLIYEDTNARCSVLPSTTQPSSTKHLQSKDAPCGPSIMYTQEITNQGMDKRTHRSMVRIQRWLVCASRLQLLLCISLASYEYYLEI